MDLFPGERKYLSWLNKDLRIKTIQPLIHCYLPESWNACPSREKEEAVRQQKQKGPSVFLEVKLTPKMQKKMPT